MELTDNTIEMVEFDDYIEEIAKDYHVILKTLEWLSIGYGDDLMNLMMTTRNQGGTRLGTFRNMMRLLPHYKELRRITDKEIEIHNYSIFILWVFPKEGKDYPAVQIDPDTGLWSAGYGDGYHVDTSLAENLTIEALTNWFLTEEAK